jgi:hypothetical protein
VCFFPRAIFRSFYDQFLSSQLVQKRPGTPNVALFLFANQTATITPGATGSNLAITTPGQEAIYSFSGAAGQLASVQVSNSTFSNSCNTPLTVSIQNPDGSTLTSMNMCASSSSGP